MYLKINVKQTEDEKEKGILATDVGYLLYKNPFTEKALKFSTNLGDCLLFFTKKQYDECEMVLTMDVDSLDLFKRASNGDLKNETLEHYVHNKSYTASVIFAQAINKVFGTSMTGVCKDRPDLADHKWNVSIELSTIQKNRISDTFLKGLFTALDYQIDTRYIEYDKKYTEWGMSNNFDLTLNHTNITMQDLISQLYIMIPVINPERHFPIVESNVTTLLSKGGKWLMNHPAKDVIVIRYLQKKELSNSALNQLKTDEEIKKEQEEVLNKKPSENELEKKESLGLKRRTKILELIKEHEYRTFVDFGCSDCNLIKRAIDIKNSDNQNYFKSMIGVDVDHRTLKYQENKFKSKFSNDLDRINLVVSSLTYQDYRLLNQDVFVLSEVIEHIDIEKHHTVLDNLFKYYLPNMIIITTPNKEYNKIYDIPDNEMRHRDHRFEWTRDEFRNWIKNVEEKYQNYDFYDIGFIGDVDEELGGSSQYVVFTKKECVSKLINDRLFNYKIDKNTGIRLDKLLANKFITTRFERDIKIKKEMSLEPLHDVSRFSVPFEQLIYVPPTMSPVESGSNEQYLEYPTDVFKYFRDKGVKKVVAENKHMGSRVISLICRNEEIAKKIFNLSDGSLGVSWTKSGYRFFLNRTQEVEIHNTIHKAITDSGLWNDLRTDWILLDSELMPWNYKGEYSLVVKKYADISSSGINTMTKIVKDMESYIKNHDVTEDSDFINLYAKYIDRLDCIKKFAESYRKYIWKVNNTSDLKIAPFHILAISNNVNTNQDHLWHLDKINKIVKADTSGILKETEFKIVDLTDPVSMDDATDWWESNTNKGAEGMVVKPIKFLEKDNEGLYVQPAVKCRGKEYLRIIYGAEYTMYMNKLRRRTVKTKRFLAMNEFLLGLEGLHRFIKGSDLESVHECVFGTLSLNAEYVDPRL